MIFSSNIQEFYAQIIAVISALMVKEKRLPPKLQEFLVWCCVFLYQGGDLAETDDLADFLIEKDFIKAKRQINNYKAQLRERGWLKGGYGEFNIPEFLIYDEHKEKVFQTTIVLNDTEQEVKDYVPEEEQVAA